MDDKTFIITISILSVVFIGLFVYMKKSHSTRVTKKVKPLRPQKWMNGLYKLYTTVKPLSKTFDKIQKRTSLLYPTDITDINLRVTKSMTYGIGIAIVCIIFTLLTAKGSFFYICSGLTATYIFFTYYINSSFESTDVKLLSQFKTFTSNVRHNYYLSKKRIDDAVYMTIDESPLEMSLHAQKFYDILKAVDIQKEADKYIPLAPNRFFLLFIAICTSVGKYGDKPLESGKTALLNNLTFLKKEVAIELHKIKRNTLLFSGYVFVCILPLFFIKPIELWADKNFPELKSYYHGFYGTVCTVVIFCIVLISYTLIMNLKSVMQQTPKEHPYLHRISKVKFINRILTYQMDRNYSKAERINDKLKMIGEKIGPKQFYLKQIIYAVVAMIVFQTLMFSGTYQQKKVILTDFSNKLTSSYVSDEEYQKEMKEFGQYYLEKYKDSAAALNHDDLTLQIQKETSIHKKAYAEIMANTIIEKMENYHQVYYKWWYLILSIMVAVISYNVPRWILNNKIKSMKMSMEDEINQFQTLVMMLMHADGMSVGIILEWMERFSYCFKESITTCINELPKGEEQALKKMRDSETFEPFRRFVNNMLIVNKQGLEAAFDEIITDKELSSDERKEENETTQQKKSSKGALLCILPTIALVGLLVIYPFMAMSSSTMNSVNSLDAEIK